MKKYSAILLLLLYLLTNTGLAVNVNYCMGEASGFSINTLEDTDDCCKKSCDCCTSKVQVLKISDSQQRAAGVSIHQDDLLSNAFYHQADNLPSAAPKVALLKTPVTLYGRHQPIYLSTGNFRI